MDYLSPLNIETIKNSKARREIQFRFQNSKPHMYSNTFECINYPKAINITLSQTIKAIALTAREFVIPVDFRACLHKVIASFHYFHDLFEFREMSCTCGDRKI